MTELNGNDEKPRRQHASHKTIRRIGDILDESLQKSIDSDLWFYKDNKYGVKTDRDVARLIVKEGTATACSFHAVAAVRKDCFGPIVVVGPKKKEKLNVNKRITECETQIACLEKRIEELEKLWK